MATIRLNAGNPATYQSRGVSASQEAVEITPHASTWRPNLEPVVYGKCGCRMPWPVLYLLNSIKDVKCDLHGITTLVDKGQKGIAQCQESTDSQLSILPLLDPVPF